MIVVIAAACCFMVGGHFITSLVNNLESDYDRKWNGCNHRKKSELLVLMHTTPVCIDRYSYIVMVLTLFECS